MKARGNYRKRKFLSEETKSKIVKDQNRDNAMRTRRRKKLYDYFLTRVLDELCSILEDRDNIVNSNSAKNASVSNAYNILFNEKRNMCWNIKLGVRLDRIRKFVIMRVSSTPQQEAWDSVCSNDIVQKMSNPVYRKISDLGVINGEIYECRGIRAVIDDTFYRNNFFTSVIR